MVIAKNSVLDAINILNDHNSISGSTKELVQLDNLARLEKATNFSQALIDRYIPEMARQALNYGENISLARGPNDKEFLVLITRDLQNEEAQFPFLELKLAHGQFRAQKWNPNTRQFVEVPSDILEHTGALGGSPGFKMFIPAPKVDTNMFSMYKIS